VRAARLVQDELPRLGWTQADLVERRKGGPDKVRLGAAVAEGTCVTLAWITGRLQMGSVAYLNNRLYLLPEGRLK